MNEDLFLYKAVRAARVHAGLTQQQLADKLGMTRARIAIMESDRWAMGERLLVRVAEALELKPSELVAYGEDA